MVTRNILCTHEGKKVRFVPVLVLMECLKQIKLQTLILTCAPISELPSNISTMVEGLSYKFKFTKKIVCRGIITGYRKMLWKKHVFFASYLTKKGFQLNIERKNWGCFLQVGSGSSFLDRCGSGPTIISLYHKKRL